ncbi:DUF4058 family protein [Laspinema olomoucense]|uniref:DUF4058 family protein n=1 Tax=Laspinema olomoucense D3b TaxID=2953688 RepID=A0ABT2N7V9_9CYAN|nr:MULTISPECIES: DUF4058 family protein [unclassified Laspinema]MCT7973244.1 DUF4058 family protein [Laspinema sp. D3d]MCT7978788.1 DUF4058 family protein [Laspinema sp. D3b]MCT7989468.1 DUF4058 family protein [Laspinema sp. D3a]
MPSPFPGMDPYLEGPNFWPEVHSRLMIEIADLLVPQLRPKYRVAIEKRVYESAANDSLLVGIPDVVVQRRPIAPQQDSNVAVAAPPTQKPLPVEVPMMMEFREAYLEVREMATGEVVTAIEVLSPANKRQGKGREMYEEKRSRILASRTHLVEIDLLRGGEPMPVLGNDVEAHYRILVSRGDRRPYADLYLFNLPETIPTFPLPLRSGDTEPLIDLNQLLNHLYDRAGYDFVIDYQTEPIPALAESEAAWVDAQLREQGIRE